MNPAGLLRGSQSKASNNLLKSVLSQHRVVPAQNQEDYDFSEIIKNTSRDHKSKPGDRRS